VIHKFRINIIIRVFVLTGLITGLVFSLYQGLYLTTAFLAILLVIAVYSLVQYVNQTNRDLANFFTSVQYNDFTTTASARHRGESFGDLYEGFNLINRKFKDIRAEKEANHQFLQTIIEHVEIGLLCIDRNDEIILMNKALGAMLHKSYLINLSGLRQVNDQLYDLIKNMKAGERELIKLNIADQLMQLAVQRIDLRLQNEPFHLLTFQNIRSELEEQELVAWQKLIRILTHEIMNSVAPISSLSSTLKDLIGEQEQIEEPLLQEVKSSLDVIEKRSRGLLNFTETYRTLTRIPPPKFQLIDAGEMIRRLHTLFKAEMEERKIVWEAHLPPVAVTFQGDPALLEQVFINLIKNSIEAMEQSESPQLILFLQRLAGGKIQMQLIDNGPGIPEETLDQIFVPFFTTKERGSGIGLSLSRQILRLHKGNIELQSKVGEGTVATVTL
jgi:nitrogen fixation/metabolism regulation signal transduction histidine kinase